MVESFLWGTHFMVPPRFIPSEAAGIPLPPPAKVLAIFAFGECLALSQRSYLEIPLRNIYSD
jgi:hypothetical protein